MDSPGIDLFRVARAPAGCSSTASSGTATSFNLGQGSFVPTQLIVSQDGSRAYVIVSDRGSVLVFNIFNQTSSAIPLSGDAVPVRASLTPDGSRLYVAAADGQVHVLDTQNGGDILQISFPTDATTFQAGLCGGVDLHLQSGSDRGQTVKQSSVVSRQSVGPAQCGRERPRSCHPGRCRVLTVDWLTTDRPKTDD